MIGWSLLIAGCGAGAGSALIPAAPPAPLVSIPLPPPPVQTRPSLPPRALQGRVSELIRAFPGKAGAVIRSVEIKSAIVGEDERESGRRAGICSQLLKMD